MSHGRRFICRARASVDFEFMVVSGRASSCVFVVRVAAASVVFCSVHQCICYTTQSRPSLDPIGYLCSVVLVVVVAILVDVVVVLLLCCGGG